MIGPGSHIDLLKITSFFFDLQVYYYACPLRPTSPLHAQFYFALLDAVDLLKLFVILLPGRSAYSRCPCVCSFLEINEKVSTLFLFSNIPYIWFQTKVVSPGSYNERKLSVKGDTFIFGLG